jgi:hypothetical protein
MSSSTASTSPSDTEAEAAADKLLEWFQQHGGWLNPNIKICHTAADGYHMRACNTLEGPFNAVACPLALSLSHLNLDPHQTIVPVVDSDLRPFLGTLPTHVLTRLLLIEQLVKEEKSRWHPYILMLPDQEDFTTAMWFDSKYLDDTPVEKTKMERNEQWKREWKIARAALEAAGLQELYNECTL